MPITENMPPYKPTPVLRHEWTLAKLVRCKEAWLIMLAFGLMMLVSNCVMPLLFPHFLDVGVSPEHRAEPHDHLRHCGHSPELFLGLAG